MTEPHWRENFPVSWTDDHYVTRREFTKSLALVSCAAFASNGALVALHAWNERRRTGETPPVLLGKVGDLPVGGSRVFEFPEPGNPCLLVRLEEDLTVAYFQNCTHLGCPVVYRAEPRCLYCPCHEGFFSAETGEVLSGPPPRALPRVELQRRGDELWATGIVFVPQAAS